MSLEGKKANLIDNSYIPIMKQYSELYNIFSNNQIHSELKSKDYFSLNNRQNKCISPFINPKDTQSQMKNNRITARGLNQDLDEA